MAEHLDEIAALLEAEPRAVLADVMGCLAIVATLVAGLHLAALF